MKKLSNRQAAVIMFVGLLIVMVLEFLLHRKVVFIKDDLWYATNLITGEPLAGLGAILESQKWHFMNWGGRSITHFILQFVLMGGTWLADVLNIIFTLTLSYLMCVVAKRKSVFCFCLANFMLLGLNADTVLSMFWQSGSVNYLYSTNWILLFLLCYLQQLSDSETPALKGICVWIIPLGLVTGWSNENMGPACFLFAGMVIFYLAKGLKRTPPIWMWEGLAASLVGSVLVVCAPGNFVRGSMFEEQTLGELIYQRFTMMLSAGAGFLFPTAFFLLIFALLYIRAGNKLQPFQILLLLTGVLAYGGMALSPTFPGRATFGIMVLFQILILSFLGEIKEKKQKTSAYVVGFALCMCVLAIYVLATELSAPLDVG